jgi:hypothetical protein
MYPGTKGECHRFAPDSPLQSSALSRSSSHPGYGHTRGKDARDDAGVRSRLTWGSAAPPVVCLLAVAVMSWAAFSPFVDITWGDCLVCGPPAPPLTESLTQAAGSRGQLVLVLLVVLGIASATHLGGIRRRMTAVVALGASLIAIYAAVSWPGSFTGVGTPPPIDYGFYVFVGGAIVAAAAAVVMVAAGVRGSRLRIDTALRRVQM